MQFSVKTGDLTALAADCLVVGVFQNRELTRAAETLNTASGGKVLEAMREDGFSGKSGETQLLLRAPEIAARRVLLVGLGKREELRNFRLEKPFRAAAAKLQACGAKNVVLALNGILGDDEARAAQDIVTAFANAFYRFDACKSKKEEDARAPARVALHATDSSAALRNAIKAGEALAAGMTLTRDLGNLPGNICTPTYLAEQAKAMGKTYENLKVTVLDEKKMEELGMGALLSVSRGSRQPARLIIFEYKGGKATQKPHVLVGKGLTFDAGGISLKPAPAMDEMKFDMCGGASVFGTMKALCEYGAKLNVIGIVPASENLPDGAANKPGDIVTSMSGQTIEILNTDAEGRLILCDALTYAERYKPETVIDIATLTGACVIALGAHATGLLGNDDALIDDLRRAADISGDRVWPLPLWDDYQEQLKSPFADVANVGGREAGTITAACFLARFTKKFRWAHLDVAGTAWTAGANKGATGRPVPLLFQYLLNKA
ncbi:MAG TPA: leucyl aminopeptidase [Gammaproteobacteria bacterium]|nr:leucyl aminopeptidase [Gammaproteobacteria bacterium]